MIQRASRDWLASLRMWRLWTALGREDILDRYRRSSIGMLWITLSFAAFVAVKVSVFGQMTTMPATEFGLFVTIGFGVWTFVNAMVLEACTAFVHSRHWILGVCIPYPVYLLQGIFRNLIAFGAIFVVVLAAVLWKGQLTTAAITVVPALAIHVLTAVWLSALLAPACARFRDLHHTIQTGMRLLFFLTPILWIPSASPMLSFLADINPVTHYIEIVRAPLLHGEVPLRSWLWVGAVNLAGLPAGLAAYAWSRRQLIFWV